MGKARTHTWQQALPKEGGSGIPKTRTVLYYNRGSAGAALLQPRNDNSCFRLRNLRPIPVSPRYLARLGVEPRPPLDIYQVLYHWATWPWVIQCGLLSMMTDCMSNTRISGNTQSPQNFTMRSSLPAVHHDS